MKIVDLENFLRLPSGTVYTKYGFFEDPLFKVYEKEDLEQLIGKLIECKKIAYE